MATAVKEKPILFSAEMVRAVLDGRKTMTRRVVKPQPERVRQHVMMIDDASILVPDGWDWVGGYCADELETKVGWTMSDKCPYEVGDRLWVSVDASSDSRTTGLPERFESRVFRPRGDSGCWEWFGRVNKKKYGVIRHGTRHLQTHRLAYELERNCKLTPEQHVLHTCDLPWCVNPSHLYVGDNEQNILDKVSRGRQPHQCGEDNGQSRFTWEQVLEMRSLYWEQGMEQKEIAQLFGTNQPHVSKIVNAKRWGSESTDIESMTGSRTLEITKVRVEQLGDISWSDAIAEGCHDPRRAAIRVDATNPKSPLYQFRTLWEKINGEWNPGIWVWVVSFKRV